MRTTAMSSSGAVASTRPASGEPSGRRIVTDTLPVTTCTFVRIVSGDTKKPLPYAPPASTRTTAGSARLITSSSAATGATMVVTADVRLPDALGRSPSLARGRIAVASGSVRSGRFTFVWRVGRTIGRAAATTAAGGAVRVWSANRQPAKTL